MAEIDDEAQKTIQVLEQLQATIHSLFMEGARDQETLSVANAAAQWYMNNNVVILHEATRRGISTAELTRQMLDSAMKVYHMETWYQCTSSKSVSTPRARSEMTPD